MGGSSSNPFHGIRNWDVTKGGNAVFSFVIKSGSWSAFSMEAELQKKRSIKSGELEKQEHEVSDEDDKILI
jgi:hypothetical protein